MDDAHVAGASKLDKLDQESVQVFLGGKEPSFTGVTMEALSSFDENKGWQAPNFVTECFFLAHVAYHCMEGRVQKMYEQFGKEINRTAGAKDFQALDEFLGMKMCLDVHVVGKQTLSNFRALLTFSGALLISMARYQNYEQKPHLFENIEVFQEQILRRYEELRLFPVPLDLALLPVCLVQNLGGWPKIFRRASAEAYFGQGVDLNMQLSVCVKVILLGALIKNPHARAEMVQFLAFLMPQSVLTGKDADKHHQREDALYKDVFFTNRSLRLLLVEALVTVYVDAEKTGYYEKASFRFFASGIMEFVWGDKDYRQRFIELGKEKPGLFLEFCNFVINDLSTLLFDGLLELEEIRDYEALLSDAAQWS